MLESILKPQWLSVGFVFEINPTTQIILGEHVSADFEISSWNVFFFGLLFKEA